MEKMWVRAAAYSLVIAALVFAVASRWHYDARASDHSIAAETKSKVQRSSRIERRIHGEGATDHLPIDTGELRREALELLDGLEEFGKNIDKVERQARLSTIFRKWGQTDFEEARLFLETEEAANKLMTPSSSFADKLILASLIGYSRTDPFHAWDVFLTTQSKEERLSGLRSGYDVGAHEVATEEIMRAVFTKSEKSALKMLRDLDLEHSHLIAPSLRAIMSASNDAALREELFKEYESDKRYGDRVSLVCAGLAEHDPQLAWDLLGKSATSTRTAVAVDPQLFLSMEFIRSWSQRQPEEALRFVAEFKSETLQDEAQAVLLMSFISIQSFYRPELIVEALELDSLKRFLEDFRPDLVVEGLDYEIPWPLIDENVPLSRNERFERLQQAVESSGLSKKLKDDFLTAIEAARLK